MPSVLIVGMAAALVGVAWHLITRAGELADGWPTLLDRLTTNERVHKVAHDCAKCVAGQVALWSFPFFVPWTFAGHLVAVCLAIVAAAMLSKLILNE